MILKEQDDRIADVMALKRLLSHPRLDERGRRRIAEQIRNLESGDLGEAQAAYILKVHFGSDPDWMVINDLRIVHEGLVAQIDHLLINRLLDVWVCESKRFSNGVKINEHGEFITFWNERPRAVPSPIQQTRRQLIVLQQLLDANILQLPTRLGFTIRPKLNSLILIAGGAISRPKTPIEGLESVIMADQVKSRIDKQANAGSPFDVAKLIGRETLRDVGEQFLSLHRPIQFDWERRLGLAAPKAASAGTKDAPRRSPDVTTPVSSRKVSSCAVCAAPISKGVADFCAKNIDRFKGRVLCMDCQRKPVRPADANLGLLASEGRRPSTSPPAGL